MVRRRFLEARKSIQPGSKFWLKFFHDNGGSAEKKRESAGVSYKNNGGYRRFLEIQQRLPASLGKITAITVVS